MSNHYTDLEKKIASALEDADITSSALAALLQETEAAIVAADEAAKQLAERALDPVLSPDPVEARTAMEDAAFAANRLRTLRPRLQARLTEVQAEERLAQWRDDYEAQKVARDALASELRELYPEVVAKLTDLFARIAANDEELSRLHVARPAGVALHLNSAELEARNLDAYSRDNPPLAEKLKLPDWDDPTKLVFPPPQTPLAVLAAQSMAFAPHSGENWWQDREARAASQRAENERVAAYNEEQHRRREERENAEERTRVEQARRAARG